MEKHEKDKMLFIRNFFSSFSIFLLIIVILALFIRLIVIFMLGGDSYGGDAANYKERADNLLEGKIPYRDFIDSKPPMLTITVAFWFLFSGSSSLLSIKILFSLFDLICIVIGYFYFKEKNPNTPSSLIFPLMIALNPLIFYNSAYFGRHYIIPATLLLISLLFVKKGQEIKSAIILGVAIMYTYFSALFLLPLILYIKEKKSRVKYMVITIITALIILSPFLYLAASDYFDNTIFTHTEKAARGFSVWVVVTEISGDTYSDFNLSFIIQALFLTIITMFFIVSSKFSLRERETQYLELFMITFYLTFLLLNKHVLMQYFVIPAVFLPFSQSILKIDKNPLIIDIITFYIASWAIFLVYRLEYEYFKEFPQFALGVAIIYLATLIPLIFLLFSIKRDSSNTLNKEGSLKIAK